MSDDWDWETKQKLATIEHWKQRAEGYELRLKAQVRQKHELKAKLEAAEKRVEELETELRIDRAHRANQNIIDLLDFADARPDLWEYLLHKNQDKVSKLLEVLK